MIQGDSYHSQPASVSWIGRRFPSLCFYQKFIANVLRSSAMARREQYGDEEWTVSSYKVLKDLEALGAPAEITGLEHVRQLDSPCVFVANHMSTLETMVLPAIIQPIRDVTFVVKQSLLDYPVFKHIATARDPIAVARDNPREDLKAVINGGIDRLGRGISVVVFPQTTRSSTFDPQKFNTIGIKLAVKAKVPIIPVALQTDAWGNGKWIKDFGPVDPSKPVRFAFGPPIQIEGRGADQHKEVIHFIETKLQHWNRGDAAR
ncbi:1-acyl-sn-glycerol-3-phosphate acyltransferase [Rubripirellula obstinata]|uniref:1-acyl-sn-glycerol-3-phosphate acyltransferase n=1 Tax=Rubripirellula obstinata TaxID=406547 RepID=A0A5B1CNL1_9BACT|nr:lysophospholipid acyltransferase family protein [Rubripirellula obstinata]KAA1261881.1 1-acyl-sn-glycerol-3-phosphate acyltransferase [Rubripirellula obstinata]